MVEAVRKKEDVDAARAECKQHQGAYNRNARPWHHGFCGCCNEPSENEPLSVMNCDPEPSQTAENGHYGSNVQAYNPSLGVIQGWTADLMGNPGRETGRTNPPRLAPMFISPPLRPAEFGTTRMAEAQYTESTNIANPSHSVSPTTARQALFVLDPTPSSSPATARRPKARDAGPGFHWFASPTNPRWHRPEA